MIEFISFVLYLFVIIWFEKNFIIFFSSSHRARNQFLFFINVYITFVIIKVFWSNYIILTSTCIWFVSFIVFWIIEHYFVDIFKIFIILFNYIYNKLFWFSENKVVFGVRVLLSFKWDFSERRIQINMFQSMYQIMSEKLLS